MKKLGFPGNRKTHGMSHTKIYKHWSEMKGRCFNHNNIRWKDYGGRGISVCDKRLMFEGFMEDMGDKFEIHNKKYGGLNTQLDRIDNNGNYCKENCRWATLTEQANNKRCNVNIEYNGKKQTISQWANEIGIDRSTIRRRIKKGYEIKDILFKGRVRFNS